MHELALAQSIVDIVDEEARRRGFGRVRVLRLTIGAFGHVEPAALSFCFEAVARGTAAEGAALDIIRAPGEGQCLDCEKMVPLGAPFGPCPECGGRRVRMTSGDELRIRELEVE